MVGYQFRPMHNPLSVCLSLSLCLCVARDCISIFPGAQVIAVRADGSWAVDFTTERMAWGVVTSNDSQLGLGSEVEPVGGGRLLVGIDEPPPRATG